MAVILHSNSSGSCSKPISLHGTTIKKVVREMSHASSFDNIAPKTILFHFVRN
jgi:hypothetical protein